MLIILFGIYDFVCHVSLISFLQILQTVIGCRRPRPICSRSRCRLYFATRAELFRSGLRGVFVQQQQQTQLKKLNGTASPSSMVCGKFLPRVSGRNRLAKPPIIKSVPIIINGNTSIRWPLKD